MLQNDSRTASSIWGGGDLPLRFPRSQDERIKTDSTLMELTKKLSKLTEEHSDSIVQWGTPAAKTKEGEAARTKRNEAIAEALGFGGQQYLTSTFREEIDGQKGLKIVITPIEGGNSYSLMFRIKDGKASFVSVTATVVEEEPPKPKKKDEGPKTLKEFTEILNSQDSERKTRHDYLTSDPGLKNAITVYEKLLKLEEAGTLKAHTTVKSRVERAAWISRNLHAAGKEVTEKSVLDASKEVDALQAELRNSPLLKGRTGVFLAHMETLADVNIRDPFDKDKKRPLGTDELARFRESSRDDHVFGKKPLIDTMREQMGADALSFIRPEDSQSFAVVKVLKTHKDLLQRWTAEGADEPTKEQRDALKTDLKKALGMKEDAALTLSYIIAKDGGSASLAIYEDKKLIANGSVLLVKGIADEIVFQKEPPTEAMTAKAAKAKALKEVETNAPGDDGFIFVFDGHGSGSALYLSHGQPRPGGFVEVADTVSISAKELADSFLARQKKFKPEKPDVVVLACCIAPDFARDVAQRIKDGGGTPPIFICQTEYGQFGYSTLAKAFGSNFSDMLFRKPLIGDWKLGDVFDALKDHDRYNTNPSIYVPGPGKTLRQISDNRPQKPEILPARPDVRNS